MTKSRGPLTGVDIRAFTKARCEMKDVERVREIVNDLINGGVSRLQFLSDFDYTMSKQCRNDGTPAPTSFKLFNKCKSVPTSFLEEEYKLRQIYRPIEIDPDISSEDKTTKMREWWEKSMDLFNLPFEYNRDIKLKPINPAKIHEATELIFF